MSSIVSTVTFTEGESINFSTDGVPSTEVTGKNLEIIAHQGEENIITVEGNSPVTIFSGTNNDQITTQVNDQIFTAGLNSIGGDGNDDIMGGIDDDTLIGGEGNDTLKGGVGADFIFGGDGNDLIIGGLPGMDANDDPVGDILQGGAGDDIFEFVRGIGKDNAEDAAEGTVIFNEFESGAVDEIVDFQNEGADKIRIFGVGDDVVSYDSETGLVSIDGDAAIDIGKGLEDIEIERKDGTDTWEIF